MTTGLIDSHAYPNALAPSRFEQAVETSVFLFLIVPSLVLSLFVVRQGSVGFPLAAVAAICHDLALVLLILFFLWRNREPLSRIGWTPRGLVREVLVGLVLFVPMFVGAALVEKALLHLGLTRPSTPLPNLVEPQGRLEALLAILLVAVVAVSEETIFRGYLLLRFPVLLRSTGASVVLSSVIFAVGHGYEGTAGLATVGLLGAYFAVVYLWRGSLVAPMVLHFLQDFVGIVLLPLLGSQ